MDDFNKVQSEQHANTYIAGEDSSRLKQVAREFGLTKSDARIPKPNVRSTLQLLWNDDTLERARMHSVGALLENEHIDDHGDVHMTLTVRKRRRKDGKVVRLQPDYNGDLSNLFQSPGDSSISLKSMESIDEIVDVVEGGSLTAAIFGIVKGTIGPAVLFLPRGFQMAGYAFAIPTMILATTAYIYSANRLLQCWKVEKNRAIKIDEIRGLLLASPKRYGAAGDSARPTEGSKLLTYPELARRAFGRGAIFVQLGIALMQFGVCLTYLIFVPQNLYEAIRVLFGWDVSKTIFLIAMVMIEVSLSWIRDIRRLTPFNVLATLLIAYGLFSCLVLAFWEIAKDPESSYFDRLASLPPTNSGTWILFIGTAVSARACFHYLDCKMIYSLSYVDSSLLLKDVSH